MPPVFKRVSDGALRYRPAGVDTAVDLPYGLLKSNSGTDTSAGATNVDTYAMASGLTAKDRIRIFFTWEAVVAQSAAPKIYNSTDSLDLGILSNDGGAGNLAGGVSITGEITLQQAQSGATIIGRVGFGYNNSGLARNGGNFYTFTTNWTGAWTLALRHEGVTAGGTAKWSWSVYKLAGQ